MRQAALAREVVTGSTLASEDAAARSDEALDTCEPNSKFERELNGIKDRYDRRIFEPVLRFGKKSIRVDENRLRRD